MKLSTPTFIKVGFALEVVAFVIKAAAFFVVTGAALLSETLHSAADVMDSVFLYAGIRLSRRPPDVSHPFGYGKETFFWALLTSLFMITVSATLSIDKGIAQLLHPHPLRHIEFGVWSMVSGTALSLVTLAMGLYIIFRGRPLSLSGFNAFLDPTVKVKVAEDVSAVLGNLLALAALYLYTVTGNILYDGIAGILVGLLIAGLGLVAAMESKDLIIGRSATRRQKKMVVEAALSVKEVVRVMDLKTMMLGPDEILVNIEVNLVDGLDTDTVELVMDKVRERIQAKVPKAKQVQVEAESI